MQCNIRSRPRLRVDLWLARALRSLRHMSPRKTITKKLEATFIVMVSTGLAIFSAERFERSGPDRELLRHLKEMQEARRAQGGNVDGHPPMHPRWNAPPPRPLPRYAQR